MCQRHRLRRSILELCRQPHFNMFNISALWNYMHFCLGEACIPTEWTCASAPTAAQIVSFCGRASSLCSPRMTRQSRGGSGPGTWCSSCRRALPRSVFQRSELSASSDTRRCRDCAGRFLCSGCHVILPLAQLGQTAFRRRVCLQCKENAQIDRLLLTPKDEVTHHGPWRALQLQRGAEYELMLVCNRHGVHEPSVLQNIVSFNRVPFVVSYGGMHHCELCDEAFSEVPTLHRVRMVELPRLTDWAGCPGDPLAVQPCFTFAVSEVRRSGNGNWFFRTLARQPEKKTQESSSKAFHVLSHTGRLCHRPSRVKNLPLCPSIWRQRATCVSKRNLQSRQVPLCRMQPSPCPKNFMNSRRRR